MKYYDVVLDVDQVLGYEPVVWNDEPKVNRDGETQYVVEVLVDSSAGRRVESIKFYSAVDPKLNVGAKPVFEGLQLLFWENGNRSGISLSAEAISTSDKKSGVDTASKVLAGAASK